MNEKPNLTILYRDKYLVAIDKPAGLFVHRSFLGKAEQYYALQLVRDAIGQYVYPLHRLDRPTSGVLLFALTEEVARLMGKLFMERKLTKTYFALTRGHLSSSGTIDYALTVKRDKIGDKYANEDKQPQQAVTHFQAIATATVPVELGRYNSVRYSLLKLTPETGRKHQIRRHLAHLRHPILGDINYGDNKQNPFFEQYFGFKRLMLFAQSLSFQHPMSHQTVQITSEFDPEWQSVFKKLAWQHLLND